MVTPDDPEPLPPAPNLLRSALKDNFVASEARKGNIAPLMEALKVGLPIGTQARAFLVEDLNREVAKPKGNRRTGGKRRSDLIFLVKVVELMCDRQITENAAITILVEEEAASRIMHPMGLDTARKTVERAKKDFPEVRAVEIEGRLVAPWSDAAPKRDPGKNIWDLLTKSRSP